MIGRIVAVALGGLLVATGLDWALGSSGGDPETEDDPTPDDGNGDGDEGGDDLEQLEARIEELRETIGGHLERLDGRVPDELAGRIDAVLERTEEQRAANTDVLERLRQIEQRLEDTDDTDDGMGGGEPPDDDEPETEA